MNIICVCAFERNELRSSVRLSSLVRDCGFGVSSVDPAGLCIALCQYQFVRRLVIKPTSDWFERWG